MDLLRFLKDKLFAPAGNIETDTKHYITAFEWTFISPRCFVINLYTGDTKCPKITFNLAETSANKFLPGKLDGNDIRYVRDGSKFTVQCGANVLEKHALFEHLTTGILRNLNVRKYHFHGNVYFEFVFTHTAKFETFTIDSLQLTVDETETLLDGITVDSFKSNFCDLYLPEDQGTPKKFQLNHRKIFMRSANWLHLRSVLSSTSEKIILVYDPDNAKQLSEHFHYKIFAKIVKNWAKNRLEKLKLCQIQLVSFYDTELSEKVFKVLREKGLTENKSPRGTVRRSDGKTGKLEVLPCQFLFSVTD